MRERTNFIVADKSRKTDEAIILVFLQQITLVRVNSAASLPIAVCETRDADQPSKISPGSVILMGASKCS
jgi:hypothetical protein